MKNKEKPLWDLRIQSVINIPKFNDKNLAFRIAYIRLILEKFTNNYRPHSIVFDLMNK